MRSTLLFNAGWLFAPRELDERAPDSAFEPVTLPHTNVVLPWHNFDNAEYQFISTYRKHFTLPEARAGRRVYVDFDGAMIAADVFINGQHVATHGGGYTPFSADLTPYLHDGDNVLRVRLDSTERADIPPYGFVVDYLTFGGLYRDAHLRMVEPCYIADVFARPLNALTQPRLELDVTLVNESDQSAQAELAAAVEGLIDLPARLVTLAPGERKTVVFEASAPPEVRLWTPDSPALYVVRASLLDAQGSAADQVETHIGWREAHFDADGGFTLNGQPLKLRGLNRHQTYPYIGAAAPARLQRKDADILRDELGVNLVRTSHYPQSPHFLDRCDEIGLLVFEEIPGWQYIGDDDWQALTLANVEAMIRRDRNHPSIILWGVRINESPDDHDLYVKTNALARRLDATRQTGGVRNFLESELLEDVYTFNDFSKGVLEPRVTPHLITEFNGHMFPTKTWDGEERAIEHALRHAAIQDAAAGNPRVSGAIGWCAFDYNTHREFGSGDRLCYHGVSDIFRLPKMAAYFYESQQPPARRPVVRAATYWTMGDRSEGGNDPLTVFSNCEEIDVYCGAILHGRFQPDRVTYPHLDYPPFTVPGLPITATWGSLYEDLRVIGYIGGQAVAEEWHAADGLPKALLLTPDDAALDADGADMTRLTIRIVDAYGNRLPYAAQAVTLTVDGPAEIIGENPFVTLGGQGAVYLKARREKGVATIHATTPRLPAAQAQVRLR